MSVNTAKEKTIALEKKGVTIPHPEAVYIDEAVDIANISGNGVVLHGGTKLFGGATFIHDHTVIGREGAVTIDNCQIGSHVRIASGAYTDAVFLDHASLGYGSHVRAGTILEEHASIAHTVGLKQTILFPYVTLGSLINFCDCLMAGGSGKAAHSEVGSSYIHFNFTANQDKATPSIFGDVPKGVMLKERPIFLGGQGGLVGPCRLAYGTVVAAGTIVRKDELRPNRLIFGGNPAAGNMAMGERITQNVKKILTNNFYYIGNLIALKNYYTDIRSLFVSPGFPEPLHQGLLDKVTLGIRERVKRLRGFGEKIRAARDATPYTLSKYEQAVTDHWPDVESYLLKFCDTSFADDNQEAFIKQMHHAMDRHGQEYMTVITHLDTNAAEAGTAWLQKIVDHVIDGACQAAKIS